MSTSGTSSSVPPAPIALSDLERRIAALWAAEPWAADPVRRQLMQELADLDAAVEQLVLLSSVGRPVPPRQVRLAAERYLALRDWFPERGRAA